MTGLPFRSFPLPPISLPPGILIPKDASADQSSTLQRHSGVDLTTAASCEQQDSEGADKFPVT
ncbi:unnamed protein product [Rhodiola kirilowii]